MKEKTIRTVWRVLRQVPGSGFKRGRGDASIASFFFVDS